MMEIYKPTSNEKERLRMKPEQFKVSGDQIFFSLQGEGQNMGKSAVFLRLQFCNLRCGWCDTKYTWDKNTKEFWREAEDLSIQHAVERISNYPTKRLIITGGEPMLQQKRILKLIDKLPNYKVEIETNGTIKPLPKFPADIQFNVSPKLKNSGDSLQKRYKQEVLKEYNRWPNSYFKFVVSRPEDISEIQGIVDECKLDSNKIIIMPEGITQKVIRNHALSVSEQVKSKDWRLLPRLQVMLWGTKRKL